VRFNFVLDVINQEEEYDPYSIVDSRSYWNRIDERRIDLGAYQFSDDMAHKRGRGSKTYSWIAQVSVQAALWIIYRYIDKFLKNRRNGDHTDEDVVVSKNEMRRTLLAFLRELGY